MSAPPELSKAQLEAIEDPAALLEHSWELEPWGRYEERAATLDRLAELLDSGRVPDPPGGRDWRLELLAERSIDSGRERRLDEALDLVQQVCAEADPTLEIALGRAMLSSGQAWAWVGTDEGIRESNRAFADAAERFAAMGHRDWQGSALLRRGYSACYQFGDVAKGEEFIRQALEAYPPGSDRLPGAYVSYTDVLTELGEYERAQEVLDRAAELAVPERFGKARAEIDYVRAQLAAHKRDPQETVRLLLEVERLAADQDWFKTHIGTTFLLESAEMLDRVGLAEEAQRYFERARQRAGDHNDEVAQTRAVMRARSGDPEQALEDLQRLARGDWLEKRVVWRHTLLIAWATFRTGRAGAGEVAARALQQAQNCGTYRIASAAEPEIVGALAPLAARTGSVLARELILRDREIMLRLFGRPTLTRVDGGPVELPLGMPGELVRMLAIHEHGLPVDVVLDTLFRDVPVDTARARLRQILRRLREAIGDVVVRDGESLCLIPAWIDVREFLSAAGRVPAEQGPRRVLFAYSALALHGGVLLPDDIYAEWADDIREEVRSRHLAMLDLVAADASSRGSHHEALTALEAAVAEDPDERSRHTAITEHLRALGRNQAADHYARRAGETMPPAEG